ncbi:MAG: DUF2752 domain-containing protein [Acidobacteria bacterium]|nr:DUF2752 domain-containing protein [Acidobacteriota bacterium]
MTKHSEMIVRVAAPIGALCFCAVTDPSNPPPIILCPFRLLTGYPCPFCGMTRGVSSILRGRLRDALEFHFFAPLVFAGIVGWIVIETGRAAGVWRAERLRRLALDPAPWLGFLIVCTIYVGLRWCGILNCSRI